jgi:ParB-like chromosome segregation protein Spo0J
VTFTLAKRNNDAPIKFRICLVNISSLRPHERIDASRLRSLKNEIFSDGFLKKPIVVDEKTNVIIDGHHRVEVLHLLGCIKIPVCYVEYMDNKIGLRSNIRDIEITKDKVIEAALNKNLFDPKSTWHYIRLKNGVKHISHIQKRIDFPLESLK